MCPESDKAPNTCRKRPGDVKDTFLVRCEDSCQILYPPERFILPVTPDNIPRAAQCGPHNDSMLHWTAKARPFHEA